jgi:DNA repair protein RecO (recombination protein O)
LRIELQPAYVLHTRPYRESCLLVDVLSRNYGRLILVAKGARKVTNRNKQNIRHLLQPFMPVVLSWLGKSNLKTLSAIECRSAPVQFYEKRLYSAFYINELLTVLLKTDDLGLGFYDLYKEAITNLANMADIETVLRHFEFTLLELLGYGIDFYSDANNGQPLSAQSYYRYVAGLGFVEVDANYFSSEPLLSGVTIQCIANNDLRDKQVRHSAKYISRTALKPYLNGKLLKSRELFQ